MIWFDIWYNKNKTVKMVKFELFFLYLFYYQGYYI